MASNRNDALQLMYPLADALQFSLFLCHKKGSGYFIKGHGSMELPVFEDHCVGMSAKVVASSIRDKEAYVIVKVLGDLHFLLAYDSALKELNFTLLDAKLMDLLPSVYDNKSYKALFEMILPHVRGMWMREEKNATWSRLDEIGNVGQTPVGLPEETSRPDHSVIAD